MYKFFSLVGQGGFSSENPYLIGNDSEVCFLTYIVVWQLPRSPFLGLFFPSPSWRSITSDPKEVWEFKPPSLFSIAWAISSCWVAESHSNNLSLQNLNGCYNMVTILLPGDSWSQSVVALAIRVLLTSSDCGYCCTLDRGLASNFPFLEALQRSWCSDAEMT